MKFFALLLAMCVAAIFPCHADEENFEVQYNPGYTLVHLYGYQIKFIAEQRASDNLAQVVVIPQQQGVIFSIQSVDFASAGSTGEATANVQGVFQVKYNVRDPIRVTKTVPVPVSTVQQFSVSDKEVQTKGLQRYQQKLQIRLQK